MLRHVHATRYVTPFREGGSLPGLMEADDDGLYVVKFRGAGHGARALIAELVGGELARAIGLPVPELVFIELDAAIGRAEPDYEIRELVSGSGGTNVALDFLPGSITFNPASDPAPDAALAADVVWLDSLVMNVDRMPQNPNMLVWHERLYLIDHGSSLYVHSSWRDPEQVAAQPFDMIAEHVLLPYAGSLVEVDERLAPRVDRVLLERVLGMVPDDWLEEDVLGRGVEEARAAYVDFLLARLEAHETWVARAEEARRG